MNATTTPGPPSPAPKGAPPADPAERRNSRLLSTILLILGGVFGALDTVYLISVPGYRPPWFGYAFLAAGFLLNRSGRYTAAAALTLTMFPAVLFGSVLSGSAADAKMSLAYLVLGVLLSSILLSIRTTLIFAAANAGGILLLPIVAPAAVPSPGPLAGPLALLAVGTGLAVVSIVHRAQIERERRAERERLIRALEDKNSELERFTYTVSHDLKSPLVTIRGFAGAILTDAAEGRIDRLRDDAQRIVTASERMQRLLDELLALSRVGRVSNPSEPVSLRALAAECVELLHARLQENRVEVEIATDLPEVHGDRVRLLALLQNLVENAAKFAGGVKQPRIRIGVRAAAEGGPPVLFVADNGIGIDPRHHERVFGLFEKLDAGVEGTGVGLALVKRIVEVHGGRIWIESAGKGQGTTMCFTLPGRPRAPRASQAT